MADTIQDNPNPPISVAFGQTVPPAEEPVTLTEMKLHLRVDHTTEDDLITALITAAREWLENATHKQFVTATWVGTFPRFYDVMKLRRPPLASVTSIQYVDSDGDTQTLATSVYDVSTTAEPGRISLAYAQAWPSIRVQEAAVTVTYQAGFGDAEDVPASIKQAIMLLAAHWYENREASISGTIITDLPLAVQAIVHQHMTREFH